MRTETVTADLLDDAKNAAPWACAWEPVTGPAGEEDGYWMCWESMDEHDMWMEQV
jgi:hypothetical protein